VDCADVPTAPASNAKAAQMGMNRSLMTLPFPVPHQSDELPARDQSS